MWLSLPFLYPPPASVYVSTMSVVSSVLMAFGGLSELRGENAPYSKFWHASTGGVRLPGRVGMLLAYAPALTAAAASFAVPGIVDGRRGVLLSTAIAVHFLKRVLEVLFIHQFSGSMPLSTALTISSMYTLNSITMIYAQHLSNSLTEPAIDLTYAGVLLFAVGIAGNLYHHLLLSRLRKGGEKVYKIPQGGLFELVVCPHYLFEIAGFFGFALIAQTVYALALAVGTVAYLAGRSCATRRWYVSKFEDFPARTKALVPYIL